MLHGGSSGFWSKEQLQRLTTVDREKWMPREPVLTALHPESGEHLADIGAGLGWLTFPLAQRVGTEGRVWAIEPSPDASDALRAEARSLPQIQVLTTVAESLPLPDASLDGALWHTVYLAIQDVPTAMTETYRVLKPGGRWLIVDWKSIDTPMGPPLARRQPPEAVLPRALAVGFRLVRPVNPGPVTWGLLFEKPQSEEA